MGIDYCLTAPGYGRMVAADAAEARHMGQQCGVNVVPVHVETEGLIAVYVISCVTQSAACLVAVKKLYRTRREQKCRDAVGHIIHVGVAMVGVVEIAERMPAGMRGKTVGISLPGVDDAVQVTMLREVEVDKTRESCGGIFRLVVDRGVVVVAGHVESVGPFRGRVVGMCFPPAAECCVAGFVQLFPAIETDVLDYVAAKAVDAEFLYP